MKVENRECSVCKYAFIVKQLGVFEFIPPHIQIYVTAPLTHGAIGMFYNWGTLLLIGQVIPVQWITADPDFFYACFQLLYFIAYAMFIYKRYISLVHNKEAYWSAMSTDGKQMILFQSLPILGLFFIKNNLYQISSVFIGCFAQSPFLYYHYMALKDVNDSIQWKFQPFSGPASSS